jgi:hypothetical protein
MENLPPSNPHLEEVQAENLIPGSRYLIDFNDFTNTIVKLRGTFEENYSIPGSGLVISRFNLENGVGITPFLNNRTRYYRPRAQEILDKQAVRQYIAQETASMINKNTDSELGASIVHMVNNRPPPPPPPSGGKKITKHKDKSRNRKGHRTRNKTRHRKGQQTRRRK